jgi:ParB-like chromosome segregation protein Spo0J
VAERGLTCSQETGNQHQDSHFCGFAGLRQAHYWRNDPGEAAMTLSMASNMDSELAEMADDAANCGSSDPMTMIEQLPEVSVPISLLAPGFHLRQEGTDPAHVRLLADAAGSVKLPAILVQKSGSRIIDGLHRLEVAKLRGEWTISARIVDCTDSEALVLAIKSNTLHGLPLSRADRISGAKRVLVAHRDWSDRAVAGITGLSAKSIASLRNSSTGDTQFSGKRLGRDGKRHPVMPTEGRRRAAEYIQAHPDASLRQIARETDVSLGTVHDVRDKINHGAAPVPAAPVRSVEPIAASAKTIALVAPPSPVTAMHAQTGTGTRQVQRLAWPMISAKLARDPSLRYTEGGRAFLRWMAGHCLQADDWREFIDAIPQHWRPAIGRIAADMSEEWRQFAERVGTKLEAVG